MKKTLIFLLAVSFYPLTSIAEVNSYCLQKSFSEYGNTETCFKNISLTSEQFKQVCEPAGDEEFSFQTKYISSCPANYKGVCKGLKMQSGAPLPYVSYLYKNDIPFMKKSCINSGGTWEEGDA
jgi:hypothetical protein